MKKVMYVFLLAFLLCGCAEVPDGVQKDMDSYRKSSATEASDDFSFTYLNVSELEDNVENALQKDYGQFELADDIVCSIPEEISLMTFQYKYLKDLEKYSRDAFSLFFTPQELNAQNIEESRSQTDEDYISYSFTNETDKLYGRVGNDGFLGVLKPDAYDTMFASGGINVGIYHADRNDDLNVEYQLKDGKCTVADAVDYVNSWLAEAYKTIAPDYDYKVKTVIVREYDGAYLFDILAESFYHGVPLDALAPQTSFDEETNRTRMDYSIYTINIQMINVCQIDSFTNGNGILEPVKEEKKDSFVSLESALQFCKIKFTDFKDVVISDIGVKYTLSPVYDYIGKEVKNDNGDVHILAHPPYGPGIEVVSRPIWEFVIDVDPAEFLQKDKEGNIIEPNTHGDVRKYIYIDMLNGELHYQMDVVLQ